MTRRLLLTPAQGQRNGFDIPLRAAADYLPERHNRCLQYAQYNFVAFAPSVRRIINSGARGHG